MSRQPHQEKRKDERFAKIMPLSLGVADVDFATQTKNISCGGAYCHVDKYIEPMTKLAVTLKLPEQKHSISCKGVVVRTEEAVPTGYNIAIFFNDINPKDRELIKQYIHSRT